MKRLSIWLGLFLSCATALAAEQTTVVCDPGDLYYPLALEISQSESIPVYHSLGRALLKDPRFILWVGSPSSFTDAVFAGMGRALKESGAATSIGIISGASLADARALWQRALRAGGDRVYAVIGEYPAAGITHGSIVTGTGTLNVAADLTVAGLTDALKNADYLTFTGHGSGSYWRLGASQVFTASNMPDLPATVLSAASCQGLWLTSDPSFALTAVARGASAYAGFVFSPIAGYLPGAGDGLPFRYTSPDLTIGEAVRVQALGTEKGFAALPFYALLGDPRIGLQAEVPFPVLRIETARGTRTLRYGEAPPGVIPLRIKDGARYRFVEAPDYAAVSDGDWFYNSRIQAMNEGPDKLVLLDHPGGDLTVNLRPEPPRLWVFTEVVRDSLDHTFLYMPVSGGAFVCVSAAFLAMAAVALRLGRRKLPAQILLPGALGAVTLGLSYWLFASYRISQVVVTSKAVALRPDGIVATGVLAGCGAIIFLGARSLQGRVAGFAVALFPGLAAAAFDAGAVGVMNFYARRAAGAAIYNYSLTWMPLIASACHAAAFAFILFLLNRAWSPPDSP